MVKFSIYIEFPIQNVNAVLPTSILKQFLFFSFLFFCVMYRIANSFIKPEIYFWYKITKVQIGRKSKLKNLKSIIWRNVTKIILKKSFFYFVFSMKYMEKYDASLYDFIYLTKYEHLFFFSFFFKYNFCS